MQDTFIQLAILTNLGITLGAMIWVLRNPREPRAMLAWLLAFLLLQAFGVLLFLLVGEPRLRRIRKRRRRKKGDLADTDHYHPPPLTPADYLRLSDAMHAATRLIEGLTRHAPSSGNRIRIHQQGDEAFAALSGIIAAARHHVHLEFYLFRGDSTGQQIASLLREKAEAGVEVRLLLDFIGSWPASPRLFRELRGAGVEVSWFMPIIPWRGRWRMNFRNHRKIVVVDGQVAMTGSQNIGDEYAGVDQTLGVWQDTQLTLQGPIVSELQEIFLEDWYYASGQRLRDERFYPAPDTQGNQLAQLIPSGPDHPAQVIQLVVHFLFSQARREICISTPYFIPDEPLMVALRAAAYRGVKVRLLVPGRSDHRLSLWAGRSFYREIRAAGASISEYGLGMLHSKLVMVDGEWALIGSANMDERSFKLNFEAGVLLFDRPSVADLKTTFEKLDGQSRRFSRPGEIRWGLGESLLMGIARLAAPLL
jgi:cardiolipin synthase